MRQRLKFIVLLELLALILTLVHVPAGVLTDEAKYLLNIPYPHPPLLRWIIAATAQIPGHAFLWRSIFASGTLQASLLFWDLGKVLQRERRAALLGCYVLSSAVLLGAGSVMMAIPVAVFGSLFLWLALDPLPAKKSRLPILGLLWLASLFSAYQSILWIPLMYSAMRKTNVKHRKIALYLLIPISLLALYSLTNPWAAAAMLKVTNQDSVIPMMTRAWNFVMIWLIGGGIVGSIVGTWGVFTGDRWDVKATLLIALAYIALSAQYYYAILLTPLFAAGVLSLLVRRRLNARAFIRAQLVGSLLMIFFAHPAMTPSAAEVTIERLSPGHLSGVLLIAGPFGHEWQYESPVPVRKYSQELATQIENSASALVCTKKTCEEEVDREKWLKYDTDPVEMWIRRK